MINFDIEGLQSLVWYYAGVEGIITPTTWETIICKSVGGEHIPGDKFMSDGILPPHGLSMKSRILKFTKGKMQTVDFVQCRCPLNEDEDIGSQIIETLVKKREESFNEFNLDTMLDVSILHNRFGDDYNVRVFVEEQDRYEDLNLIWKNSSGYVDSDKKWKLKRMEGNDSAYHTCLKVKKVFDVTKCDANFTLKSANRYDIPMEEAKEKYAKSKVQ
jgi:hypothetical protein